MEAAFPRGKVATDGKKDGYRGRSSGPAERLFGGKRPLSSQGENHKRDSSEGGSKKPRRDRSTDGTRSKSKTPREKSASGGKKPAPDFEPASADKHVVRRADELSFKVSLQPSWGIFAASSRLWLV